MEKKRLFILACATRIQKGTTDVKRQREVIQKVVEKVLSLNSVSHYQSILKALSTNIQTNIDLSAKSIPSLLGYQDSFKTIGNSTITRRRCRIARDILSNYNR